MHRILLCLLLGTGISAPAQPITTSQMSPEWKAFYERQKTLQRPGHRRPHRRRTPARNPATAPTQTPRSSINDCLATETAATQKDYEDYLTRHERTTPAQNTRPT